MRSGRSRLVARLNSGVTKINNPPVDHPHSESQDLSTGNRLNRVQTTF